MASTKMEVHTSVRTSVAPSAANSTMYAGVAVWGEEASTTEDGYVAGLYSSSGGAGQFRVGRLLAGSFTQLGVVSFAWVANTYYRIRLRVISGQNVKARIWADSSNEPGTWDVDVVDGTPLTRGGWGATWVNYAPQTVDFDFFGYGLDEATAPGVAGASTLTETAATSDSVSGGAIYPASLAESNAESDAYTVAPFYLRTLADSAATSDAYTSAATFANTLIETASTSDVFFRNANILETASTTDDYAAGVGGGLSLTESAATSDSFVSLVIYPVAVTETAATAERYGTDFFTQSLLDWNFAGNAYQGLPLTALNFTRATAGTAPDSTGTYTKFTAGQPRLLDTGLWVEETRTNAIRNPIMQGGSAGTLPTNWSTFTSLTGLTVTAVGAATESGMDCFDIRFQGTPSANGTMQVFPETKTQIVQATSTVTQWAIGWSVKVVAGSLANVSAWNVGYDENTSGGSFFTNKFASIAAPPTSGAIGLVGRRSAVLSSSGDATVARIQPWIRFGLTSGAAIDVTIRFAWPQAEQGAYASTPILSDGTTAATRNIDIATIGGTDFAAVFNQPEGTIFAEYVPQAANAASRRIIDINDGSQNERILLATPGSANQVRGFVAHSSGAIQADMFPSTQTALAVNRAAIAYKQDDFATAVNNGTVVTDTVGTPPTPSRICIGTNEVNASTSANGGPIRRITINQARVSNATLGLITSPTNASFSTSVTETAATSDSFVSTVTVPNALTEPVATSDAFVGTAALPNTLTESATTSDSFTAAALLPATLTESTVTADTFTSVAPQSLQEVAVTGDTVSALATFPKTLTESNATSDRFNVNQVAVLTETTFSSDSFVSAVTFPVAVSETSATSDAYSVTLTFPVAVSETCATSDLYSSEAVVLETVATSDSFVPGVINSRTLTETVATSDTFSTTTGGLSTRTETTATSDVFTALSTLPNTRAETAATSETYTVVGVTYPVSLSESNGTSDSYTAPIPSLFRTETAATSDSYVRTYAASAPVSETVATSDAYTSKLTSTNTRAETVVTGDSFSSATVYTRTLVETAITGDNFLGGGGGPAIPIIGSIDGGDLLIGSADATELIGSAEDLELEGSIG